MLALFGVLAPAVARAQSAASFPEPAGAPAAAPPAAPAPPGYAPPAPAAPAPAAPAPAFTPPASAPAPYAPPAAAPNVALPAELTLQNLPPILPYKKGLPVPPGYRVVQRSASGLTIGGGVTFGVAYAAALVLAKSESFDNGMAYAAIPLLGPWAAIGGRTFKKCKAPATVEVKPLQKAINGCVGTAYDEVVSIVALTADGMVQAAGAALFFIGLATGYQELVRADLPKTAVTVLPEGGMALSVSGNF